MKFRIIASVIILVIVILAVIIRSGSNSNATQDGSAPAAQEQPANQ